VKIWRENSIRPRVSYSHLESLPESRLAARYQESEREQGNIASQRPVDLLIAPLALVEVVMKESYERVATSKRRLDLVAPSLAWLDVVVCDERLDAVPTEA
jgi:hypothetical protein